MADPLSLVASIIAVVGAAETISKTLAKVKLLRKAPAGLLALNNEITDLTIVLRTLEGHLSSRDLGSDAPLQNVLQQTLSLINRAKDHLLQLDQLIHYRFLESGSLDSEYKVFRIRWLRAKETVDQQRNLLKEIRQSILLQLLTMNSIQQSRIRLMVDEVFLVSNQIRTSLFSNSDRAAHQLNQQSQLLNNILNSNSRLHNNLQTTQMPATHQAMPSNDVSPESTATHSKSSVVGIKTRLAMHQRCPCPASCRCNCHSIQSFRTPPLLRNILGVLFVKYCGYPLGISKQCSDATCHSRPEFKVQAVYYFPFWLFNRLISMSFITSYFQEPSISLTMRGVFLLKTDVYRAMYLDDDQEIQNLFSKRTARPNDVMIHDGMSTLHQATNLRSFKVCRTLIDAGADLHQEDNSGLSAFTYAWNMIYSRYLDQTCLNILRDLFPDSENIYLQEREFSRLHKAILGIDSLDLEQELVGNIGDINQVDSNGLSPLTWAIRRKDTIATELLLTAGADPNIVSNLGSTALHFAVGKGDLDSIKLFLRHGATVTLRDNLQRDVLHYAAYYHCSSLEIFQILLAAGIDIETKDIYGSTALALSVNRDNAFGITHLLDLGAEIDTVDVDGDTPLLNATIKCCSNIVRLLLERGANYTISNHIGNTILHHAAQSGDLQMLHIFRNANLKSIDPNARNTKGKTAFETAQERFSKPDGFIDLFLVLLFEIRNRNDHLAGCQRSSGDACTGGRVVGEINEDESSRHSSDTEEFFDAQDQ